MGQFHHDPETYAARAREALPGYDRMQDELVAAGAHVAARRILDLGTGTGETARRCAAAHPSARLVALDASPEMVAVAARALGPGADVREGRFEDTLPEGPFELVVSALAVHHLEAPAKADLFERVAALLEPGGVFVIADVVLTDAPVPHPAPLDPAHDRPSRLEEIVAWLRDAGLRPEVRWAEDDLVVVAAGRPGSSPRRRPRRRRSRPSRRRACWR